MKLMTPRKLQQYVIDYDYEITLEQARYILKLLDEYCDYGLGFDSCDIQRATDYIVNGLESVYAVEFN